MDGRLESEARSLFKKLDFLFAELMLDGSYKWLRRLGERRFFLPDMERMFFLSFIQPLSLYRSMEWDLTEEQSKASLGQILLAQRPITLVLMMINSCSYSTNDLVFN